MLAAAVRQDGHAFDFADGKLKRDKEVVLTAVRQVGRALNLADAELQKSEDVVSGTVS